MGMKKAHPIRGRALAARRARPYDPFIDGDIRPRIPGLPSFEPLELVALPAGEAATPPASGMQFDAEGNPTAYVIPLDPPARTRDADLPAVGSFHG